MIILKIQESAIKSVESYVAKMSAKAAGEFGVQAYNKMAVAFPSRGDVNLPVWSGAYHASWNLSVGAPDTSAKESIRKLQDFQPVYSAPGLKTQISVPKYTKVYLTNASEHAARIEFEGTPSHPDPWMVAHHIVTSTKATYRFRGGKI